jgi:phosphotransferase system enzyme I (PtsP)
MLKPLQKIIQEVSGISNLDVALNTIVHQIRTVLWVDVCSVYLADEDGTLSLMATDGLKLESVGKVHLAPGEGLIGLVASQVKPVNLDDAPSHPNFRFFPETGEEIYHAFLGVPAVHHGKLVGVLAVQQRKARRFSESHVAFMVTLASQLAAIIAYDKAGAVQSINNRKVGLKNQVLEGLPGAPGIAIGKALVLYPMKQLASIPDRAPMDIAAEEQKYLGAVRDTHEEMLEIARQLEGTLPSDEIGLFDAYSMMLGDQELHDEIQTAIRSGNWAAGALREVIEKRARIFDQLDDSYFQERADDIRDLGMRILMHLEQRTDDQARYPEQVILVGDQITAMDIADVPAGQLKGIISGRGSALSHVAILARSLNIPAVMGLEDYPLMQLNERDLVVDGYSGQVHQDPKPSMRKAFQRLIDEEEQLSQQLESLKDKPAETVDGWRFSIDVNIGLVDGIAPALKAGSDGVGLYRTELPFMVRDRFPTEQEQYEIYMHLLGSFAPQSVTLRTLDVGGDKPLDYFSYAETNPFLGWRGIRMSLDHPEILLTQLRAALRANAKHGNMKLLFPMVTTIRETDDALLLLRKVENELMDEGINPGKIQVGVMIEVPAAAYEARNLATRVDFLSIGTNDLTQYMLAVDRTNRRVAKLFDPLHPAVLGLIRQVIEDGHAVGKQVGICGEAAGSPIVALALLGMNIDWLSVSTADVARIKWLVRSFTRTRLQALTAEALTLDNAMDIRLLMQNAMDEVGLGGLARPGF